jgi:hypothetical protein
MLLSPRGRMTNMIRDIPIPITFTRGCLISLGLLAAVSARADLIVGNLTHTDQKHQTRTPDRYASSFTLDETVPPLKLTSVTLMLSINNVGALRAKQLRSIVTTRVSPARRSRWWAARVSRAMGT